MGPLGRVGPGAAVYPDNRRRMGGVTVMGRAGAQPDRGGVDRGVGRAGGPRQPGSSGGAACSGQEDGKQLVCQFFLRTGTCAFGSRCKFFHPKDHRPPQLNPKGYPVRSEERNCAFYLKHGWCAFGATCKFNHPYPPPEEHPKSPIQPPTPPLQQLVTRHKPHHLPPVQQNGRITDPGAGQLSGPLYNHTALPPTHPVGPLVHPAGMALTHPTGAPMTHPSWTLPVAASRFMAGSWPSVPNPWYPVGIPSGERPPVPGHHSVSAGATTHFQLETAGRREQERTPKAPDPPKQKAEAVISREMSEESGRSSRTSFDGSSVPEEALSQVRRHSARVVGSVDEKDVDTMASWKAKDGSPTIGS
eukprot:evm.model.scf_518.6 EVM.evm.TU.scf_518.6   scf_518:40419-46427(+)